MAVPFVDLGPPDLGPARARVLARQLALTRSEELAGVLARRDIRTVYQPLVHLDSGEVVGFESLARGPKDSRLGAPAELFAQAALDGVEPELDWVCLAAAFDGVLGSSVPPAASLFVNTTGGLHPEACPEDLLGTIGQAEALLRVFVEIDDHALTNDPAGVLATVDHARELGWGVSIDDVGTSLGCLSVLPMVRADVVKLDIRLLGARGTAELAPVVAPLLRHVEATGASLVVKGIENDDDLRLARALGATYGQGHHLGRPGPLPTSCPVPRAVVPMIGGWAGAPVVRCPFEIVADRRHQRMSEDDMRRVGAFFASRALAAGSRPVVLVGWGDHVAAELEHEQRSGGLAALAEHSALVAAFGVGVGAEPLPGVRGVDLPGHDPVARQPFLVVLTESLAFAMIAVHPVGLDQFIDVVLTQDPFAVDDIAQHLLRRIPHLGLHAVLPVGPGALLRARDEPPDEPPAGRLLAGVPRPRWARRRAADQARD